LFISGLQPQLLLGLLEAVLGSEGVGLQADRLDADVGPAAAGPFPQLAVDVGLLVVEDLAADVALGHLQPVAVAVDGDHPLGPQQHGRPGRHLADPAAAPDGDHVAGLHPAQVGPHPTGRGAPHVALPNPASPYIVAGQ